VMKEGPSGPSFLCRCPLRLLLELVDALEGLATSRGDLLA
jgi:hypothetical protein